MKFTVVIPAFNAEKYIEKTIRSVLMQKRRADEIIVVNDGSFDDTGKILSQIDGIIVIEQDNKGLSAARNVAITAASGDYIALLDADDIWHPQHLELVELAIKKYPDSSWLGANWIPFNTNDIPTFQPINYNNIFHYNYLMIAAYKSKLLPSSTVIKREALLSIGCFHEEIKTFSEDKICWAELACAGYNVSLISATTCFYRQHNETISNSENNNTNRLKIIFHRHRQIRNVVSLHGISKENKIFLHGMALRTLLAIPIYKGNNKDYLLWENEWGIYAGITGRLICSHLEHRGISQLLALKVLKFYLKISNLYSVLINKYT